MKTLYWKFLLATALATSSASLCAAEAKAPTLKVGDPAPALQAGKWIQGDPVKELAKGKAYIVEFWATWCGPCRVSIPHLNEIHEKFKDKGLIVIGQDCWERDESLVAPFVKEMGSKMTYRVALDDKEGNDKGKMAETWMAAAGRNGIPAAFLVDTEARIAWIGHPMQLKDSLVEEVLAGKFDVKKAAEAYERDQKNEAALNKAWSDLNRAVRAKDWAKAEAKLVEAELLLPEAHKSAASSMRLTIQFGKGDYAAAYKTAAQMSEANLDNPMIQNQLAWQILTDKSIKERDLDLAEKIAGRASTAAKGKDPSILDTLARAQFMNGKKDKAVETQDLAVKLAEGGAKEALQKTLDAYKKGELPPAEEE
jgi:thiol-disulfide isomerase/thioredoxin